MLSSIPTALVYHAQSQSWWSFVDPCQVLSAHSPSEVPAILEAVEDVSRSEGLWAVGWVGYEAASGFDPALKTHTEPDFPAAWFALFAPPSTAPSLVGEVAPMPVQWHAELSEAGYMKRIAQVRGEIQAGETYQANLSFRLRAPAPPDPLKLFRNMVSVQRGDYAAYIDTGRWIVCSASPELFFFRDGDTIVSRPMKGTSAPGRWPEESDSFARTLREDLKSKAENTMIVDMVRNDLARIATRGSVKVPEHLLVERYPNLLQMTSLVEAKSNANLAQIFGALFPAASITGAPKIRTMELLSRLEVSPRRVYTGAIGVVEPSGRARFNVAIRTALIDREQGTLEYGVGSGVVWDSDRIAEYQECMQKASALTVAPHSLELFETILWDPIQGLYLLEYHLERIVSSGRMLGFVVDEGALRSEAERYKASAPSGQRRMKLTLSPNGQVKSTDVPLMPLSSPYTVSLACAPIHSSNRLLYHKTTERSAYDSAQPRNPDAHDVILFNERGELTESRIANIVLELDGERVTPPIRSGLLPGCARRVALEVGVIKERLLLVEDLDRASHICLINSLRGMWSVDLLRGGGGQEERAQLRLKAGR